MQRNALVKYLFSFMAYVQPKMIPVVYFWSISSNKSKAKEKDNVATVKRL